MNASRLPDNVYALILECVETLDMLEILLVARARRRAVVPNEIAAELRMGIPLVERRLAQLAKAGLMQPAGKDLWEIKPADAAKEQDVTDLAEWFSRDRARVINLVASRNLERIRALSDAFRLRGGKS